MKFQKATTLLCAATFTFFQAKSQAEQAFIKENLSFAVGHLENMAASKDIEKLKFPRTINKEGKMISTSMYDWTPGFFPGSLWYGYEFNKDEKLKATATSWTEQLEPLQTFTRHHDLGFMMYCSYGNAYRLTGNESYKKILINSANALSTRFNAKTGCIKSWNSFKSWHGDKTYYFPVIIDNMMNLEMLFFASKVSGDPRFKNIAVKHAETTMKNHFRPDYSSYHVVCYDSVSGKVEAREAAQGFADNSTWARGQAWAVYGFTMTYRETKDPRFLKTAKGLANYFINNKSTPADHIPIWDFNAWQKGYQPGKNSNASKVPVLYRDASAAAITASALLELSTYVPGAEASRYKQAAVDILHSLGSPAYRAPHGSNGDFILEHSVGSIPHNGEIDVPLVYADYYFIEALLRYQKILDGKKLF
ncbi:glycoside hydrolase family 88 protein [Niabella insulamsoli]|uniref:glycoside hydrolase family 88 protein n=1 Tax=Niabella insulamsoli TaxID=3144874 RepID=UPI0031FE1178